jgi:hypothetical protein
MPHTAPPAPASTPGLNGARAGPEQGSSRCNRARANRAGRQSSSSGQRCGGKQPTGSPLAGLGSRFGPRLQPAGVAKALGVGRGRGDEQGGRGAARAARWRLREARRAPRVVGCQPVLRPLCPANVAQPLLVHHENRRVGPAEHLGQVESRFPHLPQMFRSASSAGCSHGAPAALARSWAL